MTQLPPASPPRPVDPHLAPAEDELRFNTSGDAPRPAPANPTYQPTRAERLEELRVYVGPILAVALVVAVLGVIAWLQLRGPAAKPSRPAEITTAAQPPGRTWSWSSKYEAALASDDYGATESLLAGILGYQRERTRVAPGAAAADPAELDALDSAVRTLRSRQAARRSAAAEADAIALDARGDNAAATKAYRDAAALLAEANAVAPNDTGKDLPRQARLESLLRQRGVAPINEAIGQARETAGRLLAEGKRDAALGALWDARTKQLQLNEKFRGTSVADPAAVAALDLEIETLESAPLATTIDETIATGKAAFAAGAKPEAARAFARAIALQRELATRFPKSRHAATRRPDDIEADRDTLLSSDARARLAALADIVSAALRRRDFPAAAAAVDEAIATLDRTAREFPRSRDLPREFTAQFDYLALLRAELPKIHEAIALAVAPAAAPGGARFAHSIVPQSLYAHVMLHNPSRTRSPVRPVSDVSWSEANEFCRRLGWILGALVRLPTELEIAGPRTETAEPAVPTTSAAVDERPAEWLQPHIGATDFALVAEEAAPPSARRPVYLKHKTFRSYHVGFRFVVEPAP